MKKVLTPNRNFSLPGHRWLALCLVVLCLGVSAQVSAEPQTTQQTPRTIMVTGNVLDTKGIPVGFATILVKGTSNGTSADAEGRYTLRNVPMNGTLEFRMLGYVSQNKGVDGNLQVNAILYEETNTLEGVEVVAFGVQKKESVIGSITTLRPSELKAPSSNLTNSLAGRMAGMISYQRSGEPGVDDASFFIRGITTFGDRKDPLILIDGMELSTNDLARLQPDDIESFSIMKDATATALYGARGANGVILVRTKEGRRGAPKVNIRFETSLSQPTKELKLADPITYMNLHNEAILTRNPTEPLMYSREKIGNTVPGSGSMIYPTTDWRKAMLKNHTINQRLNLNVSGGGDIVRYYVAASYARDNGIMKNDNSNNYDNNIKIDNYTLRSNINIDLTKSTELIVRLSGNFTENQGPLYSGKDMYEMIMKSNPVLFPAKYPKSANPYSKHILFGNAEDGQFLNPYAELVRGYQDGGRSNMTAQVELHQGLDFITKGLKGRVLLNTMRISSHSMSRLTNPYYYKLGTWDNQTGGYTIDNINPDGGTDYIDVGTSDSASSSNMYFEGAVDYSRDFGKHSVSGLLVFQLRNNIKPSSGLQASLPYRNVGLSGRTTYSYDSRYVAEFNFGYNGTEKFHNKHRFGFFPSAGAAWIISNESFFKPIKHTISMLKLRVSYGLVGNDSSSKERFLYLSNINMDNPAYSSQFGYDSNGDYSTGISISRYPNPTITWETARKANFALELGIKNTFNITAEYYFENREHIIMNRASIPASMGLWTVPLVNAGKAKGHGVDISMDYNKVFSNRSWLQLRGNFTFARSKYDKYEEKEYPGAPWRSRVGYPISQQWGYIAEGLFVDDLEVANSPRQFGDYRAGDIRYRDVNRDNVIDELDMVPIGFPADPEIIYGFGASYGFKSWDFSIFFQGLGRESFWINYNNVSPFFNTVNKDVLSHSPTGHNALVQFIADNHWSENNRDPYAVWPRLSSTSVENNSKRNTWFMRDGSFLRLKQLEVGYTLPERITKKASIKSLRIYFSGTNLLCFSNFKLWDPEMAGSGLGYPIQRVYNLGINVNF